MEQCGGFRSYCLVHPNNPSGHNAMPQSPASLQRRTALSRWDNEGGAPALVSGEGMPAGAPVVSEAELVLLRIRVIALENLMIAVLAERSDAQLGLAREMADLITPRENATPHPLTLRAAAHMNDRIGRSRHFREVELP